MRAQQALRTGTGLLLLTSFFSMPGCTSSALTRLTASCPASSARSQRAQTSSQDFRASTVAALTSWTLPTCSLQSIYPRRTLRPVPLCAEASAGSRTFSRLRMAVSEDASTRSWRSRRSSGVSLCMSPRASGVVLTFSSRKSNTCRQQAHIVSQEAPKPKPICMHAGSCDCFA